MRRWLDMLKSNQLPRRIVADVGMHAAAGLADALPRMKERLAASHLIDLEYARTGNSPLRLDIHQPPGLGPHPVIIYLHGGAFAIGSKRSHRPLAAAYAAQGYLVCNVDYRLAPQNPFPAAVEDACAAWTWVLDHVREFGGDPRRVALAGESAGANLALSVVLACCTQRPEPFAEPLFRRGARPVTALLYCGFLQTSQPSRFRDMGASALAARIAEDASRSYLGIDAEAPGAAQAMADPLCIVEQMASPSLLPAMFIAAGLGDPLVGDSQRLETALQRLGSHCSAHYYPGETHAFHVMFWRENAKRCWRDTFDHLARAMPVAT
jgi:acetyl esterase